MKLEYISPELVIHEGMCEMRKNKHTIRMLEESFRDFGFIVPILVTPNYELICGEARLIASLNIGLEQIPCLVIEELDEDKVEAFRIVDNQIGEQSSWNYERKNEEIEKLKMNLFRYGLPENYFEKIDIDEFFEEGDKNQVSIFDFLTGGVCD